MATYYGISRFDREETWINYTVDNSGLPTNDIQSIAVDNNNVLWAGTREFGVVCYDGADWKTFNTDDGLINNYVLSIAIDDDNTKWFGTYYGGISSFDDKIDSIENPKDIPAVIDIQGNYPNPFNPSTTISFSIPKEGYITLSVYDITGHKVATLIDKSMSAGKHSVIFNGSALGSGVYLYKFESKGFIKTGKMLLLK